MPEIKGFFSYNVAEDKKKSISSLLRDELDVIAREYVDPSTHSHFIQTTWGSGDVSQPNIPCVLDGEIYNRQELLSLVGEDDTLTDAGLIYQLYAKKISGFPGIINGIFAFALLDTSERKLILGRDHVGSRSLFYTKTPDAILFSSKIKNLLNAGADSTISEEAVYSYLCSVSLTPPQTMYKAINALRPASMVVIALDGSEREEVYWDIADFTENRNRSFADYAEEVRELIIDAVRIRAQKGGRIGSIVSGGIDSSLVSALLCDVLKGSERLPVFSIAFSERAFSDADLQNLFYERYPVDPCQSIIDPHQYWDLLAQSIKATDSPVNDDAMVGMYRVFQLAKERNCDVLFEGEAADELFFTTHVHSEREFQKLQAVLPGFAQKMLGSCFKCSPIGGGLVSKAQRQLYRMGLSDTDRRLSVLSSYWNTGIPIMNKYQELAAYDPLIYAREYLEETSLSDPLNIYYYGLLKGFLPDDLLFKNERAASANKVINRTPFIDCRLVELAFKMPEIMKVSDPTESSDGTKLIYKAAVDKIVPDEILYRKKSRGFSQPATGWFRNELKDKVLDALDNAQLFEMINPAEYDKIKKHFFEERYGFDRCFKSVLYLSLWLKAQNV